LSDSVKVFDETAIQQIGEMSHLPAENLAPLATRFEAIGKDFRAIILTVPTDMKLGPDDMPSAARQKWLRDDVQRPLDQLLASIDRRDMLATWPDRISSELSDRDWSQLRSLLGKLRQFSDDLSGGLQSRSADRSSINAELHFDLVSKLADTCREAGLPLSRHHLGKLGYKLSGPRVIELACKTICGATFSIDQHLRDYLKLHQE
jgi:hypothetical protein